MVGNLLRGVLLVAAFVTLATVTVPEADASHRYRGSDGDLHCDLDVMFVVDRSGSMLTDNRIGATKAAISDFLDGLTADDQSGLTSFESTSRVDQSLTSSHALTKAAVSGLVANGGTLMSPAIELAHDDVVLNRQSTARDVMIVLGDGAVDSAASAKAQDAKDDDIEIFGITVGGGANSAAMKGVASDPDSTYYVHANTAAEIAARFQAIKELVSECEPPVPQFSWVPSPPCNSDDVTFTDTSYARDPNATIKRSHWSYGDGGSDAYDPWQNSTTHTYVFKGTYTVTLTVWDTFERSNSTSKTITVVQCDPHAGFDWSCATLSSAGWTVEFDDTSYVSNSALTIESSHWDWGDAQSSTYDPWQTSVQHDYLAPSVLPGIPLTYNVALTVTDNRGITDTIVQLVTVGTCPPVAEFTWEESARESDQYPPCSGFNGWVDVTFTDRSYATDSFAVIARSTWHFGDGTVEEFDPWAQVVTHRYTQPGIYVVTLLVEDSKGGVATTTQVVTLPFRPAC